MLCYPISFPTHIHTTCYTTHSHTLLYLCTHYIAFFMGLLQWFVCTMRKEVWIHITHSTSPFLFLFPRRTLCLCLEFCLFSLHLHTTDERREKTRFLCVRLAYCLLALTATALCSTFRWISKLTGALCGAQPHITLTEHTKMTQSKSNGFRFLYAIHSAVFFCCVDRHCISHGTAKKDCREKIATTKQRIDETIDNGPTQAFLYRNECSSLSFYGRTSRTKNKYLYSGRANEQLGRKEDALRSFFWANTKCIICEFSQQYWLDFHEYIWSSLRLIGLNLIVLDWIKLHGDVFIWINLQRCFFHVLREIFEPFAGRKNALSSDDKRFPLYSVWPALYYSVFGRKSFKIVDFRY